MKLELKGIQKSFGEKKVLQDISFSAEGGGAFGLLGRNGAGKTTTIKMLSCITKPTSGDAFLLGKSISTETQEVKSLIAVSPQETAVSDRLLIDF